MKIVFRHGCWKSDAAVENSGVPTNLLQSSNKFRGFVEVAMEMKMASLVSQKEDHSDKKLREKVMIGVFQIYPIYKIDGLFLKRGKRGV